MGIYREKIKVMISKTEFWDKIILWLLVIEVQEKFFKVTSGLYWCKKCKRTLVSYNFWNRSHDRMTKSTKI